ncbi:MAG: type II toxin-antitoxin system HicA family toxin [Cyanobacteria bacterium P01_E01_bin.42]
MFENTAHFENLTYSELQKFLLELGFKNLPAKSNHIILWHSGSGALIILPNYELQAIVRPVHRILIRRILIEYGLIEDKSANRLVEKIPI